MKALTCEMCGSTDLVKQDGVFVCQSCGTKYSVEEAKKMMVEGTVSVKGTVVVDNSGSIDNFFHMANNAADAGNYKEAESYCNKILEINPKHSGAWLLKGKSAVWQSTIANTRLDECINCFTNAVDNASDDELSDIKLKVKEETETISKALTQHFCNHFEEFPKSDSLDQTMAILSMLVGKSFPLILKCGGTTEDTDNLLNDISDIVSNSALSAYTKASGEYHSDTYPSEYDWRSYIEAADSSLGLYRIVTNWNTANKDKMIAWYKNMIMIQTGINSSCSWTIGDSGNYVKEYSLTDTAKESRIDDIMEWHQKIKELDPNYTVPGRPSAKSGGCYIATAVYGSYDCPEVWILRRFRDYTLADTWYGRAFIKTYYAISPTLVRWFGKTEWFRKMWRKPLDGLVSRLHNNGVEDTPYVD